jgi:hypothetical protein
MSQWSNFPNQWVQLRPCQVHLVVEQLPHGTTTMIQPRPLKNLLGEGSDLAKSPLTAACTMVCKKASTDGIFPCRRRSIFLQGKLHMEGKERIARGARGMKHVSGNDAQCRLFEAWRKKCSRSSVSRLSASLRTASSARRARRGAWVTFAAAVHARQAQAR